MKRTVLIAEDDHDHLWLIKKSLKDIDEELIECHWFTHGGHLIEFADTEFQLSKNDITIPSLIMLDLKMPVVNGFEALQRIREHEKMKYVPVVILTSSFNPDDLRNAIKMQANDYIVKPMMSEKFTNTVKQVVLYWTFISSMSMVKEN